MKKSLKVICLSTALALSGFSVQAQTYNDVLDRDLRLMMDWFEGEFDNMEQTYFEKVLKAPKEHHHERIHSIFKKVDLPEIGKNVFYVEQYQNNDPKNIYRQRLYSFTPNYDRMAIALNILSFKESKSVEGAHQNPGLLANITLNDLETMPEGCTVFWKRQANQFLGFMDQDACKVTSKRSGKTIIVSDDLVLTKEEIWIKDQAKLEDGTPVFGNPAGIPHKLIKARHLTCWMSVTNEEAENGVNYKSDLKIHDQGGEVWVTKTGKTPSKVGFRLRNVRWPYYTNTDSFVLYALKEGQEQAVSYSWAEKTADRIGINLRWVQGSCSIPQK